MAADFATPEAVSYLVRVQVKVGKRLNADASCLTARTLGRPISIKSRSGPISKTDWLVLEACGFSSESEARHFGERLRLLATIAGLCSHLGLDAGRDTTLGRFNEQALRSMGFEHDFRVPPEVHGILVLPDDGKSWFVHANASLSVTSDPGQLIEALEQLADNSASFDVAQYPALLVNSLRLLNLAMIADDSRAKIVLAIAAVEGLIRDEKWSDRQRKWFTDMISSLQAEDDNELGEIAVALASQRMHRISLRQGVFRLLKENGLQHYRARWDDLYERRSGLFHGTLVLDRQQIHRLANDTIKLCVTIVLTILTNRGIVLPPIAAVHFGDLECSDE